MNTYMEIMLRTIFAFLWLLMLTRLMGKKQISHLTFFDYVTGITIGSITAGLASDYERNFFSIFLSLTTWGFLSIVVSFIALKSRKMRVVVDGQPTVVVQNGKILEDRLRELKYNVDDLTQQLRLNNIFDIDDVEYAVLEPNGKMSVLRKSEKQEIQKEDFNVATEPVDIKSELIVDGKVIEKNLEQNNLSKQWLIEKLRERGITDYKKEVLYAAIDKNGRLYIDTFDDHLPEKEVKKITDY